MLFTKETRRIVTHWKNRHSVEESSLSGIIITQWKNRHSVEESSLSGRIVTQWKNRHSVEESSFSGIENRKNHSNVYSDDIYNKILWLGNLLHCIVINRPENIIIEIFNSYLFIFLNEKN